MLFTETKLFYKTSLGTHEHKVQSGLREEET
jgi:hypothetical protein